ncbi:response regulator transcription factor [bacterium]|nr:response regulator transcription factor [bacterium]MCP5463086.1 response regulator transcription factor [bacterium]
MKILVIEDEENIQKLLYLNLTHEKFEVVQSFDGRDGLEKARTHVPDLIILDINLPSIDGIQVCKNLKQNERTRHIPVIMLSVRKEEIDRILGFEIGADDYVTKPFSPRELLLRVKAVLKRGNGEKQPFCTVGDVFLDESSFEVTAAGKPVILTPKEFYLLKYLMRNKGRVVSRDALLTHIWGYTTDVETRTIDAHVKSLRKKIISDTIAIKTVVGMGYKLTENV